MSRSPRIDEGLDALVQSVLDGTADESNRRRLEARLADDEALRAHFDKMSRTFEALEAIETTAAPADIRQTIRREIEAVAGETPQRPVRRARRGRSWSPRWLGARQLLTAGAAAAAVALVMVMIPRGEGPSGPSAENSVGSLLPLDASGPVADRWTWSESWGQADASLLSREDGWNLRVDVNTAQDAIVTIELDPTAWEITGLNSEQPLPTEARTIPGRFELSTGPRNSVVVGIRPVPGTAAEPIFRVRVSTLDGSRTEELTGGATGETENDTNFSD